MKSCLRLLATAMVGLLMASCSSTTMSGSWSSPEYKGQIKNVYLIGVAKKETSRRIFEDTFGRQLGAHGVKGISSYNDLPVGENMNKQELKQRMVAHGADSVLLTKLIDQRTESVTNPGRLSGYSSSPYSGGHAPDYRNWGNYYSSHSRSYGVIYEPPTTTHFVILTIESVLFDLKTEKMIWSAQLETVMESNLEEMTQDFVDIVTKDLKEKGLI